MKFTDEQILNGFAILGLLVVFGFIISMMIGHRRYMRKAYGKDTADYEPHDPHN